MNTNVKLWGAGALAIAGAFGLAPSASAQAVPPTKIAIVDLERIGRECTACKAAAATLQQQVNAFEARRNQLATQLQPEAQALETAVNALGDKAPDAALAARIKTFQQSQANAQQELQGTQATLQRNQQYVQYQVIQKLQPLYAGVMTKRGANVLVETSNTLAASAGIDITADLLTALNAALPSLATTAPPPAAAPGATGPVAPVPAPTPGKKPAGR